MVIKDIPICQNPKTPGETWAAPHLAAASAWAASCSPERRETRRAAAPCPGLGPWPDDMFWGNHNGSIVGNSSYIWCVGFNVIIDNGYGYTQKNM